MKIGNVGLKAYMDQTFNVKNGGLDMNKIKFPTKVGQGPAEVNKAIHNSAVVVDISDMAKTLSEGFGKKE